MCRVGLFGCKVTSFPEKRDGLVPSFFGSGSNEKLHVAELELRWLRRPSPQEAEGEDLRAELFGEGLVGRLEGGEIDGADVLVGGGQGRPPPPRCNFEEKQPSIFPKQ